ncbi:hypothetical protein ED733_006672 [Metarhizium rileyi]|uniref:Uncharacterized protein n=1 Tax=Metarhizium rileyi (strain RCEF 4871) TaxID=1649241 RepID=A0A5C6GEG8_METRR|nr:hypothetical protein ED733_006672 [Metarhizium rileyi]
MSSRAEKGNVTDRRESVVRARTGNGVARADKVGRVCAFGWRLRPVWLKRDATSLPKHGASRKPGSQEVRREEMEAARSLATQQSAINNQQSAIGNRQSAIEISSAHGRIGA